MFLLAIMPPRWAISVARDRPSPYQERMPLLSSSLSHQPFFVMSMSERHGKPLEPSPSTPKRPWGKQSRPFP